MTIVDGAAEWVAGSETGSPTSAKTTAGPGSTPAARKPDYKKTQVVTPGDVVVTDFELGSVPGGSFYAAGAPAELGDVYRLSLGGLNLRPRQGQSGRGRTSRGSCPRTC